ncbi:class I SAM-dependent methyltransferase [Streptomyces hesseae]|uniref:Methyltransferase domain-containing protein n=1 Tax=Streptomyces hesseae TaxID=3075519 RepID=A0ABU2SKM4_9ACTN|nr:methyltransferase domain-containing protein [Streptomyces sp. DSM 40473]MDT0449518.1 methyltransferase domain-containing protein [Streptomyces sp. DSM 40473]
MRWALDPAPGPRVLDLGAGTGKPTAALVASGAEVTAVEPDPEMLTEPRRALPAVRALPGSAEAIPLSAAIGPRDTRSGWRSATADTRLPDAGVAWFGSPEQDEFPHGQRRTADSLVVALATRAGMLVIPEQERQATLGRIRAFLTSSPETARGEFTLPILTGVLHVRRL